MKRFAFILIIPIWLIAIIIPLFSSCTSDDEKEEKDEYELLYDCWWTNDLYGEDYDYEEFHFYRDGVGEYCRLKWTPESNTGFAVCDYIKVFSFNIENSYLSLDYGFGYIIRYRIDYISKDYFSLLLGQSRYDLKRRNGYSSRDNVPDFAMQIIEATWTIEDTEKSQKYVLTCRADGSYESKSYPNINSTSYVYEQGIYAIDKSRIKFTSSSGNSLLSGRIFMMTKIFRGSYASKGEICLETENGTRIKGYPE